MPKEKRRKLTEDDMKAIDTLWPDYSDQYIAMLLNRHFSVINRYRIKMGYYRTGELAEVRQRIKDALGAEQINSFSVLTLNDLHEYWRLYKSGKNKKELCAHFNISEEHCLEALEVVTKLWGRPPYITKRQPPPVVTPAPEPEPEPSTPFRGPGGSKRPPAVYSNRSPYGIASPGLGE